jgi:crossover junction endodeoxyribonuclease RuvC
MDYNRIVAFDLSLSATGWAEQDLILGVLSHGLCPKFREKAKTGDLLHDVERLSHILKFVKAKTDPDCLVVIEDFAFSRADQAHQMGGLGYLVRFWLWQNKIPFVLIGTGQLKKFTTGRGNAKKNEMLKEVFSRFHVDLRDDNIADACALCFLGRALVEDYSPTTNFQREIVTDIRKKFPQLVTQ